jgi:enoyl-CoA hydratase/carnithine racemase
VKTIEWHVSGAVREIVLNRPQQRNALDPEMLAQLTAIFEEDPGPGERVALVRAEGTAFCSGIDLRNRDSSATGARHIERMLHAIQTWPLPVVAVVQGPALAGGAELALHCDVVIASRAASFGMPLAQIGLAPSWVLAKKVVECAGIVGARELLFFGDPVPAERLHAMGAIAHVADPAELEADVARIVARLCQNAPLSLKAIKAVLNREMAFRDEIAHADLDVFVGEVRTSADAHEGMAARLARRAPPFVGR